MCAFHHLCADKTQLSVCPLVCLPVWLQSGHIFQNLFTAYFLALNIFWRVLHNTTTLHWHEFICNTVQMSGSRLVVGSSCIFLLCVDLKGKWLQDVWHCLYRTFMMLKLRLRLIIVCNSCKESMCHSCLVMAEAVKNFVWQLATFRCVQCTTDIFEEESECHRLRLDADVTAPSCFKRVCIDLSAVLCCSYE